MSKDEHDHKVLGPAHSHNFQPTPRIQADAPAEEKAETAMGRLNQIKSDGKLK